MKRAFLQLLGTAALAMATICATAPTALACTAVYVGSDASADGTAIIARSNDSQGVWGNYVETTERAENQPGRTMPVDAEATVFTDLPATTYRCTATPSMESATNPNGVFAHDAAVCSNEKGVSMTMSVTAFSNSAALEADPLVEHGISELSAVDLVTCQSATAREAVEVLCRLIDQYGSSEVNIALISDQQETWYVEMYTGHQYAAIKLPSNMVAAFGNEFSLEYLQSYEDSIVSAGLESLAESNGFAVRNEEGDLNLLATYSGNSVVTDYSHMRTWIAHRSLAPSAYSAYSKTDVYPLCFEAESKVSLHDVFDIMRNRFEGTGYCPDETDRVDMRVIGTDTALSVHAVQTYKNLPAEISCVTWESTGPAVYGVFVPISNGATCVSEPYSRNQSASEAGLFDTNQYPYYRFKELCTLCIEKDSYKTYGQPVREYWANAEKGMIAGMAKVLENASSIEDTDTARSYITDYCNTLQQMAFDDAGELLNEVRWHKSDNSNTLKITTNPETGETIGQPREIDPLEVSLDASSYQTVPDVDEDMPSATSPQAEESEVGPAFAATIICAIVVAAIAITAAARLHSKKE